MRTKATATVGALRETSRASLKGRLSCGPRWRVMSLFVTEDFLPPPVARSEVRNRIGRGGVQSFNGFEVAPRFLRPQRPKAMARDEEILPMPVPLSEVRNRVGTGGR